MSSFFRTFCIATFLMFAVMPAYPEKPAEIRAIPGRIEWVLSGGNMSYVVGINDEKMPQSVYFGRRLSESAVPPVAGMRPGWASFETPMTTTPLEYAAWGAGLALEPALKVDSANGDRTLILKYMSSQIEANRLEIVLKDTTQPLKVHLFYEMFPEGVLARWSRIENVGRQTFKIDQAASATWNLPRASNYEWSWLAGRWAAEWQLHTAVLQPGTQVLESRVGTTSHTTNPWFEVHQAGLTTEQSGPVWFGELGWSGNWKIAVEVSSTYNVRITGGYNPFDFGFRLPPGQALETPKFYAGFTEGGMGEASRVLHRFQLAELLPSHPRPKLRPVLFDSWESTRFNVAEQNQMALVDLAAKLGVERFVIDDGWFGSRNSDHSGLGDWFVNSEKFPHGLKPLIERVHASGMDFGIWVEPEMVNPDSDLYRRHPDWVLAFPDRQRTEERHQLVLNLAKPEVKEYVFSVIDRLVTENSIAFLKWDYNRTWSEPGWLAGGNETDQINGTEGREVYVDYVRNLYDILARLRKKHPNLDIESCAGGGGRVDLGILRFTDETWPSDNTDALDRLNIQYGYLHAYAPQTMMSWVTDSPNGFDHRFIPLKFRFLAAMQGGLGIGGALDHWSADDLALGETMVRFYKSVQGTIQQGSLYRLSPPSTGAEQVEYVSQDSSQAVVFAYLQAQHNALTYPRVVLQGLAPDSMYRLYPLDPEKYKGPDTVAGSLLMGEGLELNLEGDYAATVVRLERLHEERRP
ncbi:MAG: alpha-galactosidase [Edaphobacter sp.]|uniref:alpha-galactosidase n=1 Tax=Edaphobacter sp. TaxID=1934404 RepID=UPI00238B2351|nr:alpha-galactosidase [Edaphobacter sp.]MDE1175729.1 alpha-galactosidase [Edaphobacter sp.]